MALSDYYNPNITLSSDFVPGTFIQQVNAPRYTPPAMGGGGDGYVPPRGAENLPVLDPSLYLGEPAAAALQQKQGGFLSNALNRTIQTTQASLYGMLGLVGDIADIDSLQDWGYAAAARNMEEAARYPSEVATMYDITGPKTAAIWAAEKVVEFLPTAAVSLIGAGIGGIAARTLGANVIRSASQKAIAQQMAARGVSQEVALNYVATRLGGQAGAFAANIAMEGGGEWVANVDEFGMGNFDPMGALTVGVVNGALELILGAEAGWLRRITGKPASEVAEQTFRQAFSRAVLRDAGKEFTTEALQEMTSLVNQDLQRAGFVDVLNSEDLLRVLEAGVAGLIGGATFGSVTGLFERKSEKLNSTTTPAVEAPVDPRVALEQARVQGNAQIQEQIDNDIRVLETNYGNKLQEYRQREAQLKLERDILLGQASDTEGRFAELTQEQRTRAVQQREKAIMQARALQARVDEELKKQKELKAKEYEPVQKRFDRDYQKAYIEENRKDAKLMTQSITSDPEVQDGILRMAQDAAEVAVRQGDNLLAQIHSEQSKMTQTETLYGNAIANAANGIQEVSPEYLRKLEKILENSEKRIKKLQNLRNTIRRLAKKIAANSEYMLDQDLTDFLNNVQELYALSDVTEGQLYSFADYTNQEFLDNPDVSIADKQAHIRNQIISFANDGKRQDILNARETVSRYQSEIYESEREVARTAEEQSNQRRREQQLEAEMQAVRQWGERNWTENTLGVPQNLALPESQRARNQASLAGLAVGPGMTDAGAVVTAQPEGGETVVMGTEGAAEQGLRLSFGRSQNSEQITSLINEHELEELSHVDATPVLDSDPIVASAETAQRQDNAGAELIEGPTQPEAIRRVSNWLRSTIEKLPLLNDRVSIVSDPTDVRLSREALNALADVEQANESLQGMYDPVTGKIYIFANNITSQQKAIRTLIHEAVVHFGISSILTTGQRLTFYSSVYTSFKNTALWDRFMQERGQSYNQDILNDPVVVAEEFVGWFSEQQKIKNVLDRTEASLWGRIKKFVHDVLRSLGVVRITENDILLVLQASAQYLAANPKSLELQQQKAEAANEIILRFHDGTFKAVPIDLQSEPVWGTTFRSIAHAVIHNRKVDKNTSGIPGVAIFTDIQPSEVNTINAVRSINEQSAYVKDLLKYFANEMGLIRIESPDENTFQIVFGEKVLFETQDGGELAPFLAGDRVFNQISGQEMYDVIASTQGKKAASNLLAGIGVHGLRHGNGKVTLFRALETALAPQRADLPYFQSMVITPDFGKVKALSYNFLEDKDDVIEPGNVGATERARVLEESWTKNQTFLTKIMSLLKKKGSAQIEGSKVDITHQDKVIEWLQDRYHSVRKIQAFLKERYDSSVINKKTNVYANLQGLTNSIHGGQSKLDKDFVQPLREAVMALDLRSLGIKRSDASFLEKAYEILGLYAIAKHAKERNREVQSHLRSEFKLDKAGNKTTRRVPEGRGSNTELYAPSSMTNEDADFWVNKFQNLGGTKKDGTKFTIDDVMDLVYNINDTRLRLLVDKGFVTQESADLMKAAYDYYVPLRLWEEFMDAYAPNYYAQKGGSGSISVGNKKMMRYAAGRSNMPYNPVVMSVFQLFDTEAVILKNDVGRSILELAKLDTKNEIFQINKQEDQDVPFKLVNVGGQIFFKKKEYLTQGSGNIHIYVMDKNGKSIPIEIKDEWLGKALTGQNMAPVSEIVRHIGTLTRFMARMSTTWSPAFIVSNPIRDFETAMLNLGNVITENEKYGLMEKKVTLRKNIAKDITSRKFHKALRVLTSDNEAAIRKLAETDPEIAALWEDWRNFEEFGAHTRMFGETNLEGVYKNMIDDVDSTNTLKKGANAIRKAFDYLDGVSDHTENMTRFSVFRNIKRALEEDFRNRTKDQNLTPEEISEQLRVLNQKAANISLEITVNFTKKGTASPIVNTLYAFSNATIQGSARIIQNLWRKDDSTFKNMRRVGSFMAMGTMGAVVQSALCRIMMGDDEDGINKYDKIPDYVKYLNFIIPLPGDEGRYFKVPLAYGYNIFWVLGVAIDDAMRGNKSPMRIATDVVKESFGAFSPIDPSEGLANWVPTAFRPIAQIMENKTFAGTPIYPESTMQNLPDSMKTWANTPGGYKTLARLLNGVTGGSEFESGWLDVSPESIEHLVGSYFGGLGRVATDTLALMGFITAGQEWDSNNVPVVSRFLAQTNYKNTSSLYNQLADRVSIAKNAMNIARTDRTLTSAERERITSRYSTEVPLVSAYDTARRAIARLRKQEQALLDKYPSGRRSREYNEAYEKIQSQMETVMQRFLRTVNERGLPLHQGG